MKFRLVVGLINVVISCLCGLVYCDLVTIGVPVWNDLEIWVYGGFFFFIYISLWCYIVGGKYKNLLQLIEVIFLVVLTVLLVILVQIYQNGVGLNASILVNSFYFIINRVGCLFLLLNGSGDVVVPNVELVAELMKFTLVDHSSNVGLVLQLSEEPVGESLEVDDSDEDEEVEEFSAVPVYEAFGFIVVLNVLVHCFKFAPYVAPVVAPIVGPAVVPVVAAAVAVAVVAAPVVPPVAVDMFLDFMESEVQR